MPKRNPGRTERHLNAPPARKPPQLRLKLPPQQQKQRAALQQKQRWPGKRRLKPQPEKRLPPPKVGVPPVVPGRQKSSDVECTRARLPTYQSFLCLTGGLL